MTRIQIGLRNGKHWFVSRWDAGDEHPTTPENIERLRSKAKEIFGEQAVVLVGIPGGKK